MSQQCSKESSTLPSTRANAGDDMPGVWDAFSALLPRPRAWPGGIRARRFTPLACLAGWRHCHVVSSLCAHHHVLFTGHGVPFWRGASPLAASLAWRSGCRLRRLAPHRRRMHGSAARGGSIPRFEVRFQGSRFDSRRP
eukprot:scaffold1185_cov238-Pinguiococcus_pyrenoidosus.AAC.1